MLGDDLPDLGLAKESSFFAAPRDARSEVHERADWIAQANAGKGAARELAELILRGQDRWDDLVLLGSGKNEDGMSWWLFQCL